MLFKLFRAIALQHSGVECRVCRESVHRSDHFGLSEGVCRACR
jgi:intracellular sulfur oxidation DsrE/DsrF family protein